MGETGLPRPETGEPGRELTGETGSEPPPPAFGGGLLLPPDGGLLLLPPDGGLLLLPPGGVLLFELGFPISFRGLNALFAALPYWLGAC